MRPDVADRLPYCLSLVRAEIVEDDVVGLEGRDEELFDKARKHSPLMGPSNRQGASIRSLRRAARNVAVFLRPSGTLSNEPLPLWRPARKASHVRLRPVSSMKTKRLGSMSR